MVRQLVGCPTTDGSRGLVGVRHQPRAARISLIGGWPWNQVEGLTEESTEDRVTVRNSLPG